MTYFPRENGSFSVLQRKRSRVAKSFPICAKFCGTILCPGVLFKFENGPIWIIQDGHHGTSCFGDFHFGIFKSYHCIPVVDPIHIKPTMTFDLDCDLFLGRK